MNTADLTQAAKLILIALMFLVVIAICITTTGAKNTAGSAGISLFLASALIGLMYLYGKIP